MQNNKESFFNCTFLVVGGGIAGITCVETLVNCCPNESIILLTESNLIKRVINFKTISKFLFKFNVLERDIYNDSPSNVTAIIDTLISIKSTAKQIHTVNNRIINYQYLCLCTGGRPKLIENNNPRIIGIRDIQSVNDLEKLINTSKKLVLVGNGGIANEFVYQVKNTNIDWVIKDDYISSTFVDPGASLFFQQHYVDKHKSVSDLPSTHFCDSKNENISTKPMKFGAALGPNWYKHFENNVYHSNNSSLKIYYKAQIESIVSQEDLQLEFPLVVNLSSGESIPCDFVVSATGVNPRLDILCDQKFELSNDGFILVNSLMETNIACIYAAGDICCANWHTAENWFQMRLWTQARQMGDMAARSMASSFKKEVIYQNFCFELFGHVTSLFGFDVALLGCFNGQGLGADYEIILRTTPGKEYIKFILVEGRLRGAILIGNLELAETCENLILNKIDLTALGVDVLNPDIDIEDFFD